MLLFVLALPTENKEEFETINPSVINQMDERNESYEELLEHRVRKILQGVEGVGTVDVMLSMNTEKKNSMFDEEQEKTVLGIIISADGGGSTIVKAEISEAMEALFGLPSHKIKVLKRVKEGV